MFILGLFHHVGSTELPTAGGAFRLSSIPSNTGRTELTGETIRTDNKPLADLRGGGIQQKMKSSTKKSIIDTPTESFARTALTPRFALKVVSLGTLPFAFPALVTPQFFLEQFFSETPPTDLSDAFQTLFGLRELLVSVMLWFISEQGSDELCRYIVSAVLIILSPVQIWLLASSTAVNPGQRNFLVNFQIVFGVYLAVTNILAWTNRRNDSSSKNSK